MKALIAERMLKTELANYGVGESVIFSVILRGTTSRLIGEWGKAARGPVRCELDIIPQS